VVGRLADGRLGKLFVDWDTGTELAWDLDADPGETRPSVPGPEWDSLREALPGLDSADRPALDPETERRLRALGYVQ
jgi:hypothetical protein